MSDLRMCLSRMTNRLRTTGFFSIFLSSVVGKVLTFLGGMIIVRVLTKEDYGQYTYIINCYGMLFLLNDLGCNVATLQFCNESYTDIDQRNGLFVYGFSRGSLFSLITAVLLLLSPLFYPFQDVESARLTQQLFLVPLISTVNSFLLTNLRIRLENQRYARVNVATTLIQYLVILPMSALLGVRGAVWSNYVIQCLVLLYGLWESRTLLDFSIKASVNREQKRSFLKLALASQLNNGLDHTLMLLDVFLIGLFIGENSVISSYKVATTIPSALAFIPSMVMVYAVPYFARNNQNISWVRRNYFRLILASAVGNFAIAIGGILLGPWLVPLIFGSQYADAVACYTILMIGYFFSATFRVPSANVIYTQRKIRINLLITLLTGCANCVLDVVLIMKYGSIGAAWATTGVHMINSALSFGYMSLYLRRKEL